MSNTTFIDLGKENEKAILTMANSGLFKLTIGVSEDGVTPIIKVDVRSHRKGIWPCGEIVYPYNCLKCYTHEQDGSFENLQSICKFISDAEKFTKKANPPATRVEYDIVNYLYGMAKYKMHTHFYRTRFPGIYMMRVYKKYEDDNGDIKIEFAKGYKGLIILTENDIEDFIKNRMAYRFLGDYVLRTYSDRMLYI